MKPTTRDYVAVLMAFAAVFLCGYGVGHLVGERRNPPAAAGASGSAPAWQQDTLQAIHRVLQLRPEQIPQVEAELAKTAAAIQRSHDEVLLEYHVHIDQLYSRLIGMLDADQAARLQRERKSLEAEIQRSRGEAVPPR